MMFMYELSGASWGTFGTLWTQFFLRLLSCDSCHLACLVTLVTGSLWVSAESHSLYFLVLYTDGSHRTGWERILATGEHHRRGCYRGIWSWYRLKGVRQWLPGPRRESEALAWGGGRRGCELVDLRGRRGDGWGAPLEWAHRWSRGHHAGLVAAVLQHVCRLELEIVMEIGWLAWSNLWYFRKSLITRFLMISRIVGKKKEE